MRSIDPRGFTDSFGTRLVGIHDPSACTDRPCTVHNPSDHHMREWPLLWRSDRHIFERICPHGTGHPDPDDVAWRLVMAHGRALRDLACAEEIIDNALAEAIHGCDGCCKGES